MLHRDSVLGQQTVESAMPPMQRSSLAPLPGRDYARLADLQSFKSTVAQHIHVRGQPQTCSLSHLLS
jgi:hypothetical protein